MVVLPFIIVHILGMFCLCLFLCCLFRMFVQVVENPGREHLIVQKFVWLFVLQCVTVHVFDFVEFSFCPKYEPSIHKTFMQGYLSILSMISNQLAVTSRVLYWCGGA